MKYESAQAFADGMTIAVNRALAGRTPSLFWANGVVFRHFPFTATESMTKEYLAGHLPIDHIEFAPMREYTQEIRTGEIIIPVLDVSNHSVLNSIAKFLAESLIKKTPTSKSS